MTKRRSLVPDKELVGGVHATRRAGGARLGTTARVVLRDGGERLLGWALNLSRGGIRIVLEDRAELGREYDVLLGGDTSPEKERRGRVVWVQEEADGTIAGIEFNRAGEAPSARADGGSGGAGKPATLVEPGSSLAAGGPRRRGSDD